ncbi:ABC transporter ATP-binding protein [Corynebacterium sp. LK2537]|uniref:ABC transporter ATP-binding protein n=1 Tax=Corynebacterium sp. LK2537 TaxID=3110471 RepID=UPI0034CFD6F9
MKTIELSHVTTTLGSGPRATTALRDCSLTAGAGEFVALTGKSGSGKTTLLRTIAGLLRPDAGTVEVAGVRVEVAGEKEILKLRRETVGIVHQEDLLLDELTAAENLLLVLTAAGSDAATARAEALRCLEQVGVADLADRLPPHEMSRGQCQRVGIARAISGNRHIILADEPSAALDSENSRAVFGVFADLSSRGHTVVVASHDELVHDYCDRTLNIRDGKLTAHEQPA